MVSHTEKKDNRVGIRIPKPLIDEVERIITKDAFYGNRQQFIESSIREKIERVHLQELNP